METPRFKINYKPDVEKSLENIPKNIRDRIRKAIEERLAIAPISYGERLKRNLKGLWKMRVGDYRIIYDILDDQVIVLIVKIGNRKNVYED